MNIQNEILKLKKEKNALILAHYYQMPEIQDIADFVGDSLALSQKAIDNTADRIIFAGVNFMAETAKILNPNKKVIIPDSNAGCSLADSCEFTQFRDFVEKHPDHKVISYINCSSEVKTISDVICTSSNAVRIVESFPKDQKLIFAPDKNLGAYINQKTGRNMLLWNGSCEIHDLLSLEAILELKISRPDAKLIAHPECKGQILEIADFIGSTSALLQYTMEQNVSSFIVATETGILHQMQKNSPQKEFLIVPSDKNCACNDCRFMKLITLEKILHSLRYETHEIILDTALMKKAALPIYQMLALS